MSFSISVHVSWNAWQTNVANSLGHECLVGGFL